MKRAILESPFAGNIPRNIAYGKLCIRDILQRGEAPLASHLLFTQPGILDDSKPEERELGIEAGHTWTEMAELVVVYDDFGISNGMKAGIDRAIQHRINVEFRKIDPLLLDELLDEYEDK